MDDGFWGFHLFGANFASGEEAALYAFEQWEPEPPEAATEAQYSAWEYRNPTWRMADELEYRIDSDFVELADALDSVISQMRSAVEQAEVSAKGSAFSHFIMIGTHSSAIWHDLRAPSSQVKPVTRLPESTATLTYLGKYNC
ncbi:hypothetical protein G3435_08050 [Pseudomonas sp. MAFF212428]|uniref:Uncharacterized protein n=1 Tax=Pseudomonas brassicae TaxID=2708063 RepID=A0A6B3NRW0_9PSED|nr:hypothetical protein [Pseudomonas brassicae]NER59933.1 hypothetical protein [Pseudomonas brassicae]NER63000.1 hypothetical protein [Pseudomonas brassicae]